MPADPHVHYEEGKGQPKLHSMASTMRPLTPQMQAEVDAIVFRQEKQLASSAKPPLQHRGSQPEYLMKGMGSDGIDSKDHFIGSSLVVDASQVGRARQPALPRLVPR